MKLYEISQEFEALVKLDDELAVNEETGEIYDSKAIDELQMTLEEKVENICKHIKNNSAEVEVLNAKIKVFADEIAKLQKQIDRYNKDSEWFMDYMQRNIPQEQHENKLWKKADFSLKFTHGEQVSIADGVVVPDEFMKVKVTESVDKTALKKAIKEGTKIEGVSIIKTEGVKVE